MPAIDTQHGRKAPSRRRLSAPTPDQQDRTASPGRQRHRARRVEQAVKVAARAERRRRASDRITTPDQRDRTRPRVQQQLDAATVAQVVRQARMDVLGKRGRGSGVDALKRFASAGVDVQRPATRTVSPSEAARLRRQGKKVSAGGIPGGATVGVNLAGQGGFRAMQATAQGIAKNPKTSVPKTLEGFKDMALGFPGAVTQTAVDTYQGAKHGDPLRGVRNQGKAGVADLVRRYGGINKPGGVGKMADRVSKEGAAPELVDFLGAGIPAVKVLDAGLGAAARAGRLGTAAERATTAARPGLRFTGGDSVPQARSRGLVGSVAQTRRDAAGRRAVAREVTKADTRAAKGAAETGERRGAVHAVVREAHQHAEVVPTRRTVVPGRRVVAHGRYGKLARMQRKDVARRSSRGRAAMKAEQNLEVNKGVYRNIASLSKAEKRGLKTAIQTGARTPKAARAAIERRLAQINRARAAGEDVHTETDEIPLLERLHAEAEKVFTPNLAHIADEEVRRGARVGSEDPALGRTATERTKAAESRRYAPQARLLAVNRKGVTITEALKTATARERRAGTAVEKAQTAAQRAELKAAYHRGHGTRHAEGAQRDLAKQIETAETSVKRHQAVARNWRSQGKEDKAVAADERAARAQERVDVLTGKKSAAQPGHLRQVQSSANRAANARKREEELRGEHAAAKETRKLVKRKKRKGDTHLWEEGAKAHQKRVRQARPEGFTEPGYFPSRRRTQVRYSSRALGGSRAVSPDRRYGGTLFEAGRETHDPIVYGQAIAQNIKRKHNWALVADTIRDHGFGWGKGLNYKQALDEIGTRGIDPESVRIVDMNALDDAAKGAGEEGGSVVSSADDLHDALTKSVHDKASANRLIPARNKVVILPREIADEILADTKPSGAIGRGFDILKGKSSRLLLGTSPAWLQFQIASNALMAGIGGVGPVSMAKSLAWWHGLKDEEKAAIEPYIGTGAFHGDAHSPMIGAASNSDIVNAYRAFKSLPFFHAPRKALGGGSISTHANPLDMLFRADHVQNNFFRRAILYNRIHRDTYRRMGKDVGTMQALQTRMMRIFQLPPEKQLKAVVANREAIERHAKAVTDFLGDFSTYTSRERKVFQRSVMFGGFLRFSLRLLFKTMPFEHPLTTAAIARLGQLQSEEVRKLLGGDALPWQLGKFYWNDDGTMKSVNVGRLNPFLNQFTNARGPQDVLGVLPPVVQAALNQAFTATSFTGKPFNVRGEKGTDAWKGHPGRRAEDMARIFFEQALGQTIAPYREWSKASAYGRPQGDDSSLLFGRRPTVSKDADTQLGVERLVARNRREKGSVGKQVKEATLMPFKPQRDTALDSAPLRRAYQEKDAIDKKIESFAEANKGGEFYYSKPYQNLLDQQKAKAKQIDRLQARGAPAPDPPRRSRRPLSERDRLLESVKKMREGDPRAELLKSIRRLREGQAIQRGER
jgi:hypothetical protein